MFLIIYVPIMPTTEKSMKWYQVIWHFIKEVAMVNGRIIYNKQRPKEEQLDTIKYREEVIRSLLSGFSRETPKRAGRKPTCELANRRIERHYPSEFEDKNHRPNCSVCSILPEKCKLNGNGKCKRMQVSTYCRFCPNSPPMCPTVCFERFHEVENPKRTCECTLSSD